MQRGFQAAEKFEQKLRSIHCLRQLCLSLRLVMPASARQDIAARHVLLALRHSRHRGLRILCLIRPFAALNSFCSFGSPSHLRLASLDIL